MRFLHGWWVVIHSKQGFALFWWMVFIEGADPPGGIF